MYVSLRIMANRALKNYSQKLTCHINNNNSKLDLVALKYNP
jgi:hypothetical protein